MTADSSEGLLRMEHEETSPVQVEELEATSVACQVEMQDGNPCGRPILGAYPGVGGTPVCLMHSRNPSKDKKAFQAEIERILDTAGDGIADFTRFVFVGGRGGKRRLVARCVFRHAIFSVDAWFARVVFEQEPDFNCATFNRRAIFIGAKFLQGVDFSESVFDGETNFARARCEGTANLMGTGFGGPVVFRACRFGGEALFVGAAFKNRVGFARSTFAGDADFGAVAFSHLVQFTCARFEGKASFKSSRFAALASFSGATFMQAADFSEAMFMQAADFSFATFVRGADFLSTTFTQAAAFHAATFTQVCNFQRATFTQTADFSLATFAQAADFLKARFIHDADFGYATFRQGADFSEATFKEAVEFRGTKFREDKTCAPGPIFTMARFENPESVTFHDTYLGQALLHDCDVTRFVFSNVRWRSRENHKRMVFEEVVDLNPLAGWNLRLGQGSASDRNHALIAELYQQLKKNFDDRRDYWTAGDFHYGEMEMKRLSSQSSTQVLRLLHRNLGLVAWYKYASEYGESYLRPALLLAVIVLLFTLLYPLAGLSPGGKQGKPTANSSRVELVETEPGLRYAEFFEFVRRDSDGVRAGVRRFFGHSLMTTLGVAFFQRDLDYQPSYPWGRVLQWVELLLTSSLIALFLLAVRRQFRR